MNLVLAVLGSTGLFSFIQFILSWYDKKKGMLAEIKKEVKLLRSAQTELTLDVLRVQLLTLMHIHPDNVLEILQVAKKYFVEYHGDWYMSSIFKQYLNQQNIDLPSWMKEVD